MAIKVASAAKDVTGMAIRKGGALKDVTEGWIRVGGALKQFYALFQVALSSYSVIGRANSAGTVAVVSAAVTATPKGAIGPVTYLWSRTAADAHAWTITSPAAATTTFSTDAAEGASWTATFICTVTDQSGQVLASAPVTVNNSNIYYGGGYVGPPNLPPGTVYP